MLTRFLGFWLSLTVSFATLAAPSQDLEAIRAGCIQFVRQQTADLPGSVDITVGQVDSRLRLTACNGIEFFVPAGTRLWGNANVGVRCSSPSPWSLYLPVVVRVTAPILFAARPLGQGQALEQADIVLRNDDLTQYPAGVLTDPRQAIGKTATAGIPAGYPLRLDMLRAPYVIQRGQNVKVVARGQGFQVNSEGKALGNASEGQVVAVKTASGKVVKGIARENGQVEVPF